MADSNKSEMQEWMCKSLALFVPSYPASFGGALGLAVRLAREREEALIAEVVTARTISRISRAKPLGPRPAAPMVVRLALAM